MPVHLLFLHCLCVFVSYAVCEPIRISRSHILDDMNESFDNADFNKENNDKENLKLGNRNLLKVKVEPLTKASSLRPSIVVNVPSHPPPKLLKSTGKTTQQSNCIHLKRSLPPVVKLNYQLKNDKDRKWIPTKEDHDCDGIPDNRDNDIDNDGLLDNTQDSDWDGLLNNIDDDDDNDGILDKDDEDANGDGIPDCRPDTADHKLKLRYGNKQRTQDSDMDGIPGDLDKDDDNDGISDMLEDKNGDQIPDFLESVVDDYLNCDHGKRCIRTLNDVVRLNKVMAAVGWSDHDCDGIPDHLDPDDDNDGFFDKKQDSDRDGIVNEYDEDDDNDGIPDIEDLDSNGDGVPDCIIKDSDGDGIPDHIDTDDDNDGIPDLKDPNHKFYNFFRDSDRDGIADILDRDGVRSLHIDSDGDGFPDAIDDDMNDDGLPDHLQDHDCDGIPDVIDPDDDNDGFFDNKQDSDKDGTLNEWDDDDDNDGIPDSEDDDSNGDGIPDCQPKDSDGDGIPDHLDDDDDNDGIPDHLDPDHISFLLYKPKNLKSMSVKQAQHEANTMMADLGDVGDKDCDGIPDEEDNDRDNDGKVDRTQDSDRDGLLNHIDNDDDNDGIPDHLDPDANGDGIPDCNRNKSVRYHVFRNHDGAIKKVIRVRQMTTEEETLTRLKEAVDHRLHRIRALMNPIDFQPSSTKSVESTRPPIIADSILPVDAAEAAPKRVNVLIQKKKKITKVLQKQPMEKAKRPLELPGRRKLSGHHLREYGHAENLFDDLDDLEVVADREDDFGETSEEDEYEKLHVVPVDAEEAKHFPSMREFGAFTGEGEQLSKDEEDDEDDDGKVTDVSEDENENRTLGYLEGKDTDGDGIPDYLDNDDDGIQDSENDEDDDIINLLDIDDDNDGIPDYIDDDDDKNGILDDKENFDGDRPILKTSALSPSVKKSLKKKSQPKQMLLEPSPNIPEGSSGGKPSSLDSAGDDGKLKSVLRKAPKMKKNSEADNEASKSTVFRQAMQNAPRRVKSIFGVDS